MNLLGTLQALALILTTTSLVACSSSGNPNQTPYKGPQPNTRGGAPTQPGGKTDGGETQSNTALNMLSCKAGAQGVCFEVDPERRGRLEQVCQQVSSQVATGACPSGGHIGTCWAHFDDGAAILIRYYNPLTQAQASSDCGENGGDFTTNY